MSILKFRSRGSYNSIKQRGKFYSILGLNLKCLQCLKHIPRQSFGQTQTTQIHRWQIKLNVRNILGDYLHNNKSQDAVPGRKKQPKTSWKSTSSAIFSINFQIFITVFTIVSLFMEDIRIIFIDISADTIVDGLNITFIIIFSLEIMMSLSVPGYLYSFFFFLDIISTLSIAMDITMLTSLLYSTNNMGSGQLSMIIRNSKASRAAARTVRVMKIFRLARIVKLYKSATKARQLKSKKMRQEMNQRLKSLRLKKNNFVEQENQNCVSFINIQSQEENIESRINDPNFVPKGMEKIQQVKTELKEEIGKKIERKEQTVKIQKNRENQEQYQEKLIDENEESNLKVTKTQSKISKLLSDNTMKKIIMVILLLMFSVPALDTDNYYQQTSCWDFLTDFIGNVLLKPEIPLEKINQLILKEIQLNINSQDSSEQLLVFETPFKQLYSFSSGTLQTFRTNDLTIASTDIDVQKVLSVRNHTLTRVNDTALTSINIILNCRAFNQIDSWFSISKILFICIGIIYLLNVFNENISQLITEPIQKMLQDVKNNGKSDFFMQMNTVQSTQNKIGTNNYQTTHVHDALTKISKMISQIFGSKGKQTIYRKIFQSGSVTENFLSKSKKGYYILGLCCIDNYYNISEILQEETLALNRQVSQYLHSAVFRYGGHAIANYEGSFLVAFQCPPEHENLIKNNPDYQEKIREFRSRNLLMRTIKNLIKIPKPRNKQPQNLRKSNKKSKVNIEEEEAKQNYLNVLADFSVFSMVKTIVKINKQAKFYKYRKNSKLVQALGENFQIKINCNLHAGWVQEGFLGSSFKIDYFCYGKPVQQLKRVAHYCRKISNSIVMTNQVYELITSQMKRYTRVIDRYSNKQLQFDQALYQVDLNLQNISPPKNILEKKGKSDISAVNMKRILNLQWLKQPQKILKFRATVFMNNKKELREVMKNVISEQFRRKYILAYQNYMSGQFSQSKQILDQLSTFNKDDHLVQRLTNLIEMKEKTQIFDGQFKDEETQCIFW